MLARGPTRDTRIASWCRPEEEDQSVLVALAAFRVDQATDRGEDVGQALDFIEDEQLALVGSLEGFDVLNLAEVGAAFQVEVQGRHTFAQRKGQRGLADLAGAEQGHHGAVPQTVLDEIFQASLDHLRIFNIRY